MTGRRAAFVSGGSSGIGFGLARALLGEGYAVTISARRPEPLEAAASELAASGGEVHHVAANFASADEVEAAVASHRDRFGCLDVLVNNAGVGLAEPVGKLTVKAVDLQFAVNLRSYLLCTNAAMELLRASSGAHVLNVSSIAGTAGQAGLAAYSASKAGVIGFTQALQGELGPHGIKATALCPAFVDTPMAGWVADEIGSDRLIRVSDVVEVALLLLRLSPACNVPTVVLEPPAGGLAGWGTPGDVEAAAAAARGGG